MPTLLLNLLLVFSSHSRGIAIDISNYEAAFVALLSSPLFCDGEVTKRIRGAAILLLFTRLLTPFTSLLAKKIEEKAFDFLQRLWSPQGELFAF